MDGSWELGIGNGEWEWEMRNGQCGTCKWGMMLCETAGDDLVRTLAALFYLFKWNLAEC